MSKEIYLPGTFGFSAVVAEVKDQSRNVRSATPALVDPVSLDLAGWQGGLVTCTKEVDDDGVETGWYADWTDTGLTASGLYSIRFFNTATPTRDASAVGTQFDPTEYLLANQVTMLANQVTMLANQVTMLANQVSMAATLASIASVVGVVGEGAVETNVYTQDGSGNPLDGVEVWITSDSAGSVPVAGPLVSDAMGLTTFMLDAGTYYLWRQLSGMNFQNPQTLVVA